MSTGYEFDGDIWVRSCVVMPLSHGFSVRVVSAPARFVSLISWVWVKSALGVENSSRNALMSSCIYKIYSTNVSISGLLLQLAGEFLRNSKYSELPYFTPELSANAK